MRLKQVSDDEFDDRGNLVGRFTLSLEDFTGRQTPVYAILSHTWEAEEASLDEFDSPRVRCKSGYEKIRQCCRLAIREHNLHYVWVDTCCIDKRSSSELSEAINSMYKWYQEAEVCYAYLADVGAHREHTFMTSSRWFTRGWTLQELIAPAKVVFYDSQWKELGTRDGLKAVLSDATGIPNQVLSDGKPRSIHALNETSVAQRLSWASTRKTTRDEDRAYSLLGLFGVNMPLLYGEGGQAFRRLQEEIIRVSHDHSIFAWGLYRDFKYHPFDPYLALECPVLAPSLDCFASCGGIRRLRYSRDTPSFDLTRNGLQIDLPMLPFHVLPRILRQYTAASEPLLVAALGCRD